MNLSMISGKSMKSARQFKGVKFRHAFQPIIRPSTCEIYGYEALARGPNEEPPWFLFERVEDQDYALLEQELNRSAIRYANFLGNSKLLFLNVSPDVLTLDEGAYLLKQCELLADQADPSQIVLELSESWLERDIRRLSATLDRLRSAGFTIALDDFGAGTAGLNSLVDVDPDIIKLDMHLIRNINESGIRQALIKSVLNFADALGILVLAEGVETVEEYRYLHGLGIDLYQGFLFARPKVDFIANVFSHQAFNPK